MITLKKQTLIPFLSVDMSTDMLINDKQKKINKRVFIDFAKMIGDVQSESSFFLKLSRDEEIFSGYKTIVKGKSRQEKENLKLKIFENFKRAKKALLGKQRKFNMEELDKEILEGRKVKDNLRKMFNIIKNDIDKGARTENIKRRIKEPTKLFSLFVRNIPEKKPSVEDFKSNKFPIYSYNLVEVILSEPSGKKEINNWIKTTKNLGGGDLETWARVYSKSEEKNFQAKKKSKVKLRSKLSGEERVVLIEQNEVQKLVEDLGIGAFDDEEKVRVYFSKPLLREVLLGAKEIKSEFFVDVEKQNFSPIGDFTDEQVKDYFEILKSAGNSENKGTKIITLPKLNGQKTSKRIFKKSGRFQVSIIPVVKDLLTETTNDSIFDNVIKNYPLSPLARSFSRFKFDFQRENKDLDLDSETGKERLKESYKTQVVLQTQISKENYDKMMLAIKEDLEDDEKKLIKENLKEEGNVILPVNKKGIEAINLIRELAEENDFQVDTEKDSSLTKNIVTAIKLVLSKGEKLENVLEITENLDKYFGESTNITIVDVLIISNFLVSRIMQVKLDDKVKKIDTIVEEAGEALSLDDPSLKTAMNELGIEINKGLKKLKTEFKDNLKEYFENLRKNKEKYPEVFTGQIKNALIKANILSLEVKS
jgi:hypothetical protein